MKVRMTNQEAINMIRNDMKLHHDYLSGTYRKALNMAISALENSIPVEPVENPNLIRGGWIGREAECCGKCGNNLRFLAKFCDKCGTPVKRQDIESINRSAYRRTNNTNQKRASGNSEIK